MNCINLKQKLDRTLFCKKKNKLIKISECNNCKYKEYKVKSNNHQLKNTTNCHQLKQCSQKSKKLAKLERNRFSILVPSNKCCMCPATANLTWHEVFRGRNRANSMKYGLCLRICSNCHEKHQEDKEFNDYWHKLGQKKFMEYYHKSIDEFIDVFGRNYL